MQTYLLKSHSQSNDYMTLLEEVDEGYIVRIVRDKDGYEEVITDFISKMLFDSCVRTGYITKVEDVKLSAITA
ncbi:MAG: hypothetical protein UH788_01165 [Treponemataceae bacterium]|nr:hypothetical protein [Spirochaetaceae bacterium]MEE0877862.1 hypothetical protein [Treponemataceae bacterium]